MLRQTPMKEQQSQRQKKKTNVATNVKQGMRQPNFVLSDYNRDPSHYVSFDLKNSTKNKNLYAPLPSRGRTACSATKSQCHLMRSLLPSLQQVKPTTSNKSKEINQTELKVPDSEGLQTKIEELERRLTIHDIQKQEILYDIQKLKQRLIVDERVYGGKSKHNLQLSNLNKSFNQNVDWLNRLKEILSINFGNDFVIDAVSNNADSDTAVIYIKRAAHNPNKDKVPKV